MQYITLFWEVLIFVPIGILIFFMNSKVEKISLLLDVSNILNISYKIVFWVFFMLVCLFIIEIIWGAIKYFFFKPRPKPMKYSNWYEKILAGSFPSLHSARTFTLFLFALIFVKNYVVVVWFFLFWVLISYSRIYLKKHYLKDILGGAVLSGLVFFLFLILFRVII